MLPEENKKLRQDHECYGFINRSFFVETKNSIDRKTMDYLTDSISIQSQFD